MAVRALPGHAEEERARHDRTGVVGELADLHGGASDHLDRTEGGDEAIQIHHRPASLPAVPEAAQRRRRSGGTSRYWRSNSAIWAKAGAETTPPKIAFVGSSTVTRITSLGALAGTMPTKVAEYLPGA